LLNNLEVEKKRKFTCESCEDFTKLNICKNCGCFMPAKWKFKYAECPLKKWV
jgi:hypothetical protein